jgi:hypothetical protein
MRQAPARSVIRCLVQKFELTGSVCDNKKSVVVRHMPKRTQDTVAHVCEALFLNPRKSVTRCSQSLGNERKSTHHHATGFDVVHFKTQVVQMLTLPSSSGDVSFVVTS